MLFSDFLDLLPKYPGQAELPILTTNSGMRYYSTGLDVFVAPGVAPRLDADNPEKPDVIIISAPGAVGKSTFAREVAQRTGAPLWDLSDYGPVGQGSLNGAIMTSFGASGGAQFLGLQSSGTAYLIIDALDEASMKANAAGFEAFLKDIGQKSQSHTVKFLLLGRTQTAETAWIVLQDAGINVSLYVIEPFDDNQVREYIKLRVKNYSDEARLRVDLHQEPFVKACDYFIQHLKDAVQGADGRHEEESREFLGYAPVLNAVATFIAGESNYSELTSKLQSSTSGADPAALLCRVVEEILEREHKDKLVKNLRPVLEIIARQYKWSAWDALYTSSEQCKRLLKVLTHTKEDINLQLPPKLKAEYDDRLNTFFQDHPFLLEGHKPANVVFESYLYAYALHKVLGCCPVVESAMMAAQSLLSG